MAEVVNHIGDLLIQYLRECAEKEQLAEYVKMSEIVGCDVTTNSNRPIIYGALSTMMADYGYIFKVRRNKGYMPLTPAEAVGSVGEKARRKINNAIGKWRDELDVVEIAKLDQNGLNRYIRESCRLQFAETAAAKTTDHKILATIDRVTEDDPLSPANMRKMLKRCHEELAGVG